MIALAARCALLLVGRGDSLTSTSVRSSARAQGARRLEATRPARGRTAATRPRRDAQLRADGVRASSPRASAAAMPATSCSRRWAARAGTSCAIGASPAARKVDHRLRRRADAGKTEASKVTPCTSAATARRSGC